MHKTKRLKALAASSVPTFVLASSQPAIKRGEMASYKCKCHAKFMAYASNAPFCVVCGSEEVEQVGEDSENFNFPKDDENVASVQCPHCYTNNIMLASVASVLDGKMHCVTCGEGVEYIAPEMPDDYTNSDPDTFLNNQSDNSLLDTADLEDSDEDDDFSQSFGDDDDDGIELGFEDSDNFENSEEADVDEEESEGDVPDDDSDLQVATIQALASLSENSQNSDEDSEDAGLDDDEYDDSHCDVADEDEESEGDVPDDDSDLQVATIQALASLDTGKDEDISEEDMDSLEPENSEEAEFSDDDSGESSDGNYENSEEAEFSDDAYEDSDDSLENSEEAEFGDDEEFSDGEENSEEAEFSDNDEFSDDGSQESSEASEEADFEDNEDDLDNLEGEGANTDVGDQFEDETTTDELADEDSDTEGGEEYTGEGDDMDDEGDFKSSTASFKIIATVQGNLSFQTTSDSLIAFMNNTPVAILTREKAGENAGLLHSQSFAEAIQHTASQQGKERALAHYGFDFMTVKLPVNSYIKQKVSASVEEAVSKTEKKMQNYNKRLQHALQIAAVGMNKSFFKGSNHALKEALYREMETAGIRNPARVIDKVFSARAEDYHKALFEKANELMSMTPEVRNQLASAISDSNYQNADVENSDEEDSDLNNALETSGIRPVVSKSTETASVEHNTVRKFGKLF